MSVALTTSPAVSGRSRPSAEVPPARRSPHHAVRRLARIAATTPGALTVIGLVLVVLCTAWGGVAATTAQQKTAAIRDLATRGEPLSDDAQQIFGSLSDADATASSAFLSGGVEPAVLSDRYQTDIARAGAAVAASVDAGVSGAAVHSLGQLSTRLPVYADLVATARADNRQGLPVGAAYLREASGMMQSELLPAAQRLYQLETDRLAADQDGAAAIPVGPALVGGLALMALCAAQVFLCLRTNRLLNIGLLAATLATLVAVLWGGVALFAVSSHIDRSRTQGSAQVQTLVQARIAAMQARSDETLTLVARGDDQNYEQAYGAASARLGGIDGAGGLLGQARAAATDDLGRGEVDATIYGEQRWLVVHRQITAFDAAGEYRNAVGLATGPGPTTSATTAQSVDEHLSTAIAHAREGFGREAEQAYSALDSLVVGIAILATLAVLGVAVGIGQRLQEYR